MSDYDRYDTRSRSQGEQRGRNRDSIFSGFGGGRDRDRERNRDRGEEMGGWAGSGRTSAYDEDNDRGGNWQGERENFSWGRGRREHGGRDRSQHMGGGMHRDHDSERMWSHDSNDRNRGHDQGERMSSGWGGIGEGHDRERHREHHQDRERMRDRERHYGPDDARSGLPIDETNRLIGSNKVEGTVVYGSDGERLGKIYNFMVDKYSGKVEYAVMSYGGGLFGAGTRYYPLPWATLTYNVERGGYGIAMRERDLRDAPSFDRNSEPEFNRDYGERVHSWYGVKY